MLPNHGCIDCKKCFPQDISRTEVAIHEKDGWRITNNPMAWGGNNPEIVVLGFSKGPTQMSAIKGAFEDIPFKSHRSKIGKIFAHIGLVPRQPDNASYTRLVNSLIRDKDGRMHFGSLLRCSVEKYDTKKGSWISSGSGMLEFPKSTLGQEVSRNCMSTYLSALPSATKLVVLFGLGSKNRYVDLCFDLFKVARPGRWKKINAVAYTDDKITVVHVDHFAVQGAHLPNWLGENDHSRARFGEQAKLAVQLAL